MDNKTKIHKLYIDGSDDEIVAYHGTSLETLKIIIETGKQPGSDFEEEHTEIDKSIRLGDVFLLPIIGRGLPDDLEEYCGSEEHAMSSARGYAKHIAFFHKAYELLSQKRISRDSKLKGDRTGKLSKGLFEFIYEYRLGCNQSGLHDVTKHFIKYLHRKNIDPDEFYRKCSTAPTVIIGYKASVLKEALPANGGNDIRVQNVTIEDIAYIGKNNQETDRFLCELVH